MGGRYNSVYSIGLLAGLREGSVFMIARYFSLVGVALLLGAGFSVAGRGQGAPSDGQKKMLTPEASLNLRTVADLQYSPDPSILVGASWGRLAFVVMEPAKGTGRLRHIWMYERASGVARQVTFSAKSEFAPRGA